MRLISQDGKGDMPYENFIFRACGGDIVASRDILTNEKQIVARYSTEAKAIKAMEMLREKYAKLEIFKSVYQKGLLTELNKELGFDEMQNTLTSIFKFPDDSEVEV